MYGPFIVTVDNSRFFVFSAAAAIAAVFVVVVNVVVVVVVIVPPFIGAAWNAKYMKNSSMKCVTKYVKICIKWQMNAIYNKSIDSLKWK